jgi:hypothetical protein
MRLRDSYFERGFWADVDREEVPILKSSALWVPVHFETNGPIRTKPILGRSEGTPSALLTMHQPQ